MIGAKMNGPSEEQVADCDRCGCGVDLRSPVMWFIFPG